MHGSSPDRSPGCRRRVGRWPHQVNKPEDLSVPLTTGHIAGCVRYWMYIRLHQVSVQIHSLSRSNSNQAADQFRVCQVDMQKLEQFPIPNDIYAKFFCNGMLLVGIDSFDFAIFSKQRPSLFKPECFSGFLSRGYAYLRGSRPPAWRC